MDAVEACLPLADDMHHRVEKVIPARNRLMSNDIQINEFKSLCHEVDDVLKRCGENMPQVHGLMTEVLMAQDFQDITGQVIRRVIQLVEDVEKNLIELLKIFGKEEERRNAEKQGLRLRKMQPMPKAQLSMLINAMTWLADKTKWTICCPV